MDRNMPAFVSILFILMVIGTCAALLAIFVSGILAMFGYDGRPKPEDNDDDHRGGDEGFTPLPWGPTDADLEQREEESELTLQ
jgi:hypothetical protein